MGAGLGRATVRDLARDSDCVLIVGSEMAPSDLWLGPLDLDGKAVRIDIDPAQAVTNVVPVASVVGDAAVALEGLLDRLGERPATDGDVDRVTRWRARFAEDAAHEAERWSWLLDGIAQALGEDGIVAADSAMVCYYGAIPALPAYRPRSFLYPTGYGTLGYAVPAALGAKLGRPSARVLALAGDGGVMFTIAELAAGAEAGLAVPVVVVDNGGYGEIRKEMRERGDDPVAVDFPGIDFAALGRALNCHGTRAESADALDDALERAFAADRPTLIHVPE
jgi:acetolactate synthase-1/2/3 large subunit